MYAICIPRKPRDITDPVYCKKHIHQYFQQFPDLVDQVDIRCVNDKCQLCEEKLPHVVLNFAKHSVSE